jgi:ferredoxin-NADP reductase
LTLSGLNSNNFLEFNFKTYKERKGFTFELDKVGKNQFIKIHDPFGTISYEDEGIFIAGGTGITPFLAIFRELNFKNKLKNNRLIFSNKTSEDVILEDELKSTFDKKNLILVLSNENIGGYPYGRINKNFLKKEIRDFSKWFYVCGPPKFVYDVRKMLRELGVKKNKIVYERDH